MAQKYQHGGWYGGRQWNAYTQSFGDVGVINNPEQVGYGQAVSEEVNRQSAAAQGVSYPQFQSYLEQQKKQPAPPQPTTPTPTPTPAPAPAPAPAPQTPSGITEGLPTGITQAQPDIDLPKLYEELYAQSGVNEVREKMGIKQAQIAEKERALIEAKGKLNDNPFLSEATRVGRVAKLESLYQERVANDMKELEMLQGQIETKKADTEMKLNLELQQFNLESDAAQRALTQLNTLLDMGALDNASGVDIANLTRSTGISSTMIQSAIKSRVKEPELKTSLQTVDDGTTQWAVLLNTQTGEVISRTELAKSKPKTYAPQKVTLSEKEADQEGAVGAIIQAYIKDEGYQAQISPEDLYRKLLSLYPMAADYIDKHWLPENIRSATR